MSTNKNRVSCSKCKHYTVTWNPKYPHACKLLGFKSAAMPSSVAYDATHKICEGFTPKNAQMENAGGIDENSAESDSAVIVDIGNKENRR